MGGPQAALDAVGQTPDAEIDIAGAALQFARIDTPDADWEAAERHLSELARDAVAAARDMDTTDVAARAGVLSRLLGRHRYAGDTADYDDPANANLVRVTERRRGLPVALGILWLHCTRAIGWEAHGVDFPGHFLLVMEAGPRKKPKTGPAHAVLDVFSGGVPLDAADLRGLLKRVEGPEAELRPGLMTPMSARRVLLRLQGNIRGRRMNAGDAEGALACTLDMLRIAPENAALWRDAAGMHRGLDQVNAALRCYAKVLELVPDGDTATRTRSAIEELRGRLN